MHACREDAKLRDVILAEVLDTRPADTWQDIAGLQVAKQASQQAHADLFRMRGSVPPTELHEAASKSAKGRRLQALHCTVTAPPWWPF